MNRDASTSTSTSAQPQVQALSGGCPQGCVGTGAAIGLALLALGALTIMVAPVLGVFAFIFAAITLSFVGYSLLARQQSESLGVTLRCEPERLRLGEEVALSIAVHAKRDCRLGAGSITLRCREVAIARGGTSDTTYTHTVYEDVRDLPSQEHLGAGSSWSADLALPVPRELPATFKGANNSIEWHILLHIGIPGPRLDVRREVALTVLPEVV